MFLVLYTLLSIHPVLAEDDGLTESAITEMASSGSSDQTIIEAIQTSGLASGDINSVAENLGASGLSSAVLQAVTGDPIGALSSLLESSCEVDGAEADESGGGLSSLIGGLVKDVVSSAIPLVGDAVGDMVVDLANNIGLPIDNPACTEAVVSQLQAAGMAPEALTSVRSGVNRARKSGKVPRAKPKMGGKSRGGASTSSKTSAPGKSKSGATGKSKSGATGKSKSGATGKSRGGTTEKSKTSPTTDTKSSKSVGGKSSESSKNRTKDSKGNAPNTEEENKTDRANTVEPEETEQRGKKRSK